MARVIMGGVDAFNALAYGDDHPGTQQFLESQFENTSQALTEAGQNFYQGARQMYERFSGSDVIRRARAARRAVGSIWQNDEIKALCTIGEMQHASSKMQRWVMAEPSVRQKFKDQTIEGYAGSYNDPFVNQGVGEDHYDYRRVMNGIVVESDQYGWSGTTYFDELLNDDRELYMDEQLDILDTWSNVVDMIRKGGDDPTSRWNASL